MRRGITVTLASAPTHFLVVFHLRETENQGGEKFFMSIHVCFTATLGASPLIISDADEEAIRKIISRQIRHRKISERGKRDEKSKRSLRCCWLHLE